jgi:hypothetical protein
MRLQDIDITRITHIKVNPFIFKNLFNDLFDDLFIGLFIGLFIFDPIALMHCRRKSGPGHIYEAAAGKSCAPCRHSLPPA